MGRTLRILHTADSHIGAELPSRPRDQRPRRGDDLVDSFERVLNRIAATGVDLVIHAGDLFNRSQPSSRALAAATDPLLRLAAAGVPVVIVPGNHERSVIPGTLFLAHPNIHVVREPCTLGFTLCGTPVAVAAFPCLRRDSARRFTSALAATCWSAARADLNILAVHQTFESATCGPGDYRFRSGDDVVERDAVPAQFDYVAAGHVHRYQVLSTPEPDGPPIVYCSSPDRVSFAEASEPKGFVLIEESGGRLVHRFVQHDVRPMSVWPLDVSGLTGTQIIEQVESILRALPQRAVAQVRLSGVAEHGELTGLRFAATARTIRPDVLFTTSAQAVEFAPQRTVRRRTGAAASAFAALDAPVEAIAETSVADVKALPTSCGVYAMHDETGRLLYVGKANNIRSRVRTHLRGKTGANFFSGWTRQIARVAARPADSELEALMVEAELIRTLRPPFNRQMRRWAGYCYLVENGKPHGQLEVSRGPSLRHRCFGPFRSRRLAVSVRDAAADHFRLALCPQEDGTTSLLPLPGLARAACLCKRFYQGRCTGPCGGRVPNSEYRRHLLRRDALLSGADDADLAAIEDPAASADEANRRDDPVEAWSNQATILRLAFDHCATLRQAEALMGGLLLLPGRTGSRKVASLTPKGVQFAVLDDNIATADQILSRHVAIASRWNRERPGRLSTTAVDSLCIVARQLRRAGDPCQFVSAAEVAGLDGAGLLAVAFTVDRAGAPSGLVSAC